MNVKFKIQGLSCGHCTNAVTNLLNEVNGVEDVKVSLPDDAEINFNENIVTEGELKQVINDSEIYKVL